VPLLFDPVFADYMQAYGTGGLKSSRLEACELLARLYWYTVEFGLIRTPQGVRAYGAGILSSAGELPHSVKSTVPSRMPFDLQRIMRTRYKIDSYQAGYFVIDSFEQLFEATAPDFTPIYRAARGLPEIEAGVVLPGEATIPAA
jgi:phenylalanine-4-hydroxylase